MERLYRSSTERVFTGLAAAVARALRLPPTLVRAAFVLLALASGIGVLLYALGTLLVPQEGTPARSYDEVVRENLGGAAREAGAAWRSLRRGVDDWRRRRVHGGVDVRRPAVWGGALVLLGLLWFLGSLDLFDWLTFGRFLALALVAAGVYLLARIAR